MSGIIQQPAVRSDRPSLRNYTYRTPWVLFLGDPPPTPSSPSCPQLCMGLVFLAEGPHKLCPMSTLAPFPTWVVHPNSSPWGPALQHLPGNGANCEAISNSD